MTATLVATPEVAAGVLLQASLARGGVEQIHKNAFEWRSLCEEGPRNEPFFRPEWIAAYLEAFDPHARLLLGTVHAGARLRAVLPLVEAAGSLCGLPARILRSPSNVHSCRFDLVHGQDDADEALARLWDALKSHRGWDVIRLDDVPEGGGAERLLALAARDGFPIGRQPTIRSPYVPMTGVSDPSTLPRDGHFRRDLRRRSRKASQRWPVQLCCRRDADPAALNEFYTLEKGGWKGQRGTAIGCSESVRRFYDAVASAASSFGYFRLYTLRFDGVPAAAHFALFYDGRYYIPKVAYNEEFASFGPGHLLIDAALRDCIPDGLAEFDFLGPEMAWKSEWTTQTRALSHCFIFRTGFYGRLLCTAQFRVAATLRSAKRHPLLTRVRAALGRD